MNHSEIVSFLWGVADLIRDSFKRGKYQDVILPLTVLRRLDCVLAPRKQKVLATEVRLKGKLDNLDPQLRKAAGFAFTKDHVLGTGKCRGQGLNPAADVHLFGQEVNPETFAICKSDLFMKSADGRDAERILFDSTPAVDRHAASTFDYQIANPPYGKDWKRDAAAVKAEHERGGAGRFAPGLLRISDGQLLFLLHMLDHRKDSKDGGSRIAIFMNGSPLFTGDAGSGESEIRRWILENDWLEALIALPEQMFYNTGIATYVWVLSNRKPPKRRGKVQLINATSFWTPMRKSLGDKRRQIPPEKANEILALHKSFEQGEHVKIFPTTHFGFRKITVERPLQFDFQASAERIARLDDERAFKNLAVSKKKKPEVKAQEEAAGSRQPSVPCCRQCRTNGISIGRPLSRRSRRQPGNAACCWPRRSRRPSSRPFRSAMTKPPSAPTGTATPSPTVTCATPRAYRLAESIEDFFEREVRPHVPDAWIDRSKCDPKDGQVGVVGYEINFNRYFYKYTPPRPLEEIESDIKALEGDIVTLLKEITA